MTNRDEKPFYVGEEIWIMTVHGYNSENSWRKDVITAISPKRGDITLEKSSSKFDPNGMEKTSGSWARRSFYIYRETPELLERINDENRLYNAKIRPQKMKDVLDNLKGKLSEEEIIELGDKLAPIIVELNDLLDKKRKEAEAAAKV